MFDFKLSQNSLYATIHDEYNVFTQVVQNEGVYFSKTWKPLQLECLHNSNNFLLPLVVRVMETPLYVLLNGLNSSGIFEYKYFCSFGNKTCR